MLSDHQPGVHLHEMPPNDWICCSWIAAVIACTAQADDGGDGQVLTIADYIGDWGYHRPTAITRAAQDM